MFFGIFKSTLMDASPAAIPNGSSTFSARNPAAEQSSFVKATEDTNLRPEPDEPVPGEGWWSRGSRTPDLLIANETLYQLSYDPIHLA